MTNYEIKHFKSILRESSLRHMNILLDDKFQKELQTIIKDYEKLQQENKRLYNLNNTIFRELLDKKYENKKQKEVINKATKYIETCNPNVELHSEILDESYLSNYGAKELLDILKEVE